jgi:hypothetical protein
MKFMKFRYRNIQYFIEGIQKITQSFVHNDVEPKTPVSHIDRTPQELSIQNLDNISEDKVV